MVAHTLNPGGVDRAETLTSLKVYVGRTTDKLGSDVVNKNDLDFKDKK